MTDTPHPTQEIPLYLHRITNGEWIRPFGKTVTETRTNLTNDPATAYAVEAFDDLWSRAVLMARNHGWRFDFINAPLVFGTAEDPEGTKITQAFLFQDASDRPYIVAQWPLPWADLIATESTDLALHQADAWLAIWHTGWKEGYAAGLQQGHIDSQAKAVTT